MSKVVIIPEDDNPQGLLHIAIMSARMGSEQSTGYFIEIVEKGIEGDILSKRFSMILGQKEVELLIDCLHVMLRQNL